MKSEKISKLIYAIIVIAAFCLYLYTDNGEHFLIIVGVASVALIIILQQVMSAKLDDLRERL